ncbi:MAG: hypothetical protein HY791_33730 [Deltaproteobacteria bacterium]|nr:hypothetical protein [Deltaproteobacteria bacterium]
MTSRHTRRVLEFAEVVFAILVVLASSDGWALKCAQSFVRVFPEDGVLPVLTGRFEVRALGELGSARLELTRGKSGTEVPLLVQKGHLLIPPLRRGRHELSIREGRSAVPFVVEVSQVGTLVLHALPESSESSEAAETGDLAPESRTNVRKRSFRVIDAETGLAIPGARGLVVEDGARGSVDADLDGRLEVETSSAGQREVSVVALGYGARSLAEARADGVLELDRLVRLDGRLVAESIEWGSTSVRVDSLYAAPGSSGEFVMRGLVPGPHRLSVSIEERRGRARWEFPIVIFPQQPPSAQRIELQLPPTSGEARVRLPRGRVCAYLGLEAGAEDRVSIRCVFAPSRFELRLRARPGGTGSYSYERRVDFASEPPRVELVKRLPNGTFEVELVYDDEWVVSRGSGEVNEERVTLSLEASWR